MLQFCFVIQSIADLPTEQKNLLRLSESSYRYLQRRL